MTWSRLARLASGPRPPWLRAPLGLSPLRRHFADPAEPDPKPKDAAEPEHKHRLKLTPELERQFEQSLFGRFPKFLKEENIYEGLKNMFIFRSFLWPCKGNTPAINRMLYKSYAFLVASRGFALLMPISIKYGVDRVMLRGDFTQACAAFAVYCASSVVATHFDNLRGMKSGKITQIVWYKMSANAFAKLLDSDWWAD